MQSVHARILMECNRYNNAELLKYAIRKVRQSFLVSLISFFLLIFLMERVLAWPTLVTQTAAFLAVMQANNNLL